MRHKSPGWLPGGQDDGMDDIPVEALVVNDGVETVEDVETLKVPLTEAEIATLGRSMGRTLREMAAITDELASVKSSYKARWDKKQAELNEISLKINTGYDYRKVVVEVIRDFRENTVSRKRTDTGEVYEMRPMSLEERQRGLDFGYEAYHPLNEVPEEPGE